MPFRVRTLQKRQILNASRQVVALRKFRLIEGPLCNLSNPSSPPSLRREWRAVQQPFSFQRIIGVFLLKKQPLDFFPFAYVHLHSNYLLFILLFLMIYFQK